ncbi:MAG: response regulator [Candidatus Hodarchaeota archaeon]
MKNPRILVVDDDRVMAETLADVLEASDYIVTTVHSGEEATRIVKQEKFDIGLLDIKMPGINGVEALKQLRKSLPDAFFAMISAYSFIDLIDEAKKEGAITVLPKPIDLDHLLYFLKEVSKKGSVVIIDDDHSFCESLSDVLKGKADLEVSHAQTAEKGLKLVLERSPDAVLLDMKLGPTTAYEIFSELKKALKIPQRATDKSNVILMTAYGKEMEDIIQKTLELSAFTCVHKPFDIEDVVHLINDVRRVQLSKKLQ